MRVNNGTEFTGGVVVQWTYWKGVTLDFARQGMPWDNTVPGSLQEPLPARVPEPALFPVVADAQETIEGRRQHYDAEGPHSSLGDMAPLDFAGESPPPSSALTVAELQLGALR